MITLIMLVPVIVFLMWLYWYTRPNGLSGRHQWLDNLILFSTPLVSLCAGYLVFQYLTEMGIWPHIMAALCAYLVLLAYLGGGWYIRLKWRPGSAR